MPPTLAESFGISEIRKDYRGWIGIATLAGFSFWVVQLIPSFQTMYRRRKLRREILSCVNSLSQNESRLLAYCVYRGQRTIPLPITNSTAVSLRQKGILEQAGGTGSALAWPYTIPSFVWKYLISHRPTLFSELENLRPNEREKVLNELKRSFGGLQ
ncbi:MAG: superinfection exclusion B family protein [Deltaproteobacteria bacterium]|nr:superinfection exclusion B family protein [Deltaproteobacteria bacterium]